MPMTELKKLEAAMRYFENLTDLCDALFIEKIGVNKQLPIKVVAVKMLHDLAKELKAVPTIKQAKEKLPPICFQVFSSNPAKFFKIAGFRDIDDDCFLPNSNLRFFDFDDFTYYVIKTPKNAKRIKEYKEKYGEFLNIEEVEV
jgi:hypothetical protein